MRRFSWALLAACFLSVTISGATVTAQEADVMASPSDESIADFPSSGEMSPEMWLYLQEQKRHDDPKQAVRRKAEMRAAQRQNRLAAQRWFGVSNLRPGCKPSALLRKLLTFVGWECPQPLLVVRRWIHARCLLSPCESIAAEVG